MESKAIKQNFEVKKVTDESVVYQRVVNSNSKKAKKLQEILSSLPTATLHTITIKEYEHLKEIEVKLLDELEFKQPSENILKKAFRVFFEI